jgi:hypothetical protein
MEQQVLKYRLSQKRLQQLVRSINRAALAKLVVGVAGIVAFVVGLILTGYYSDELESFSPEAAKYVYVVLLISFIFSLGVLFKPGTNSDVEPVAPSEQDIHLTKDDTGLCFATENTEFLVKWRGITKLWLEPDGFAVAHYHMYFFIPDSAFAGPGEKLALMQEIYDKLSDKARMATKAQFGPTAPEKG